MKKTIVQMIHEIVDAWDAANLGHPISLQQITSGVFEQFGSQNKDTITAQTTRITVNASSRIWYGSKETRIVSQSGYYDYLYQLEPGSREYVKYDPAKHGIWGVFEGDDAGKLIVRKVEPSEMYYRSLQVADDDEPEGTTDNEQADDVGIFPKPTIDAVKEMRVKWENLENYQLQEKCLRKLFDVAYPNNNDINEILVKVAVLNDFYSTNIKIPKPLLALHIKNIADLDIRLKNGDHTVVHEIANNVHKMPNKEENLEIYYYSFASKYAHHHNPEAYPIYDRYVSQVLRYFRKKDSFAKFSNADLKNYPEFKKIIETFCQYYGLTQFSLLEIDKYLWLLGKLGPTQK